MGMSVRAKVQVTKISESFYRDGVGTVHRRGVSITLTPQYDPSIEEDRRYAQATPSGEITLYVDNPPAIAYFKPGHNFYVDFVDAGDSKQ
jgi:hypothetical protein